MITVTDKQIDTALKKITAVKGKSHVLHLPDGSIIYGKLSRKQKKLAIKQAKKNLKVMVDHLSHEIDMRILERMKTEHPEYWEKKNIDKKENN